MLKESKSVLLHEAALWKCVVLYNLLIDETIWDIRTYQEQPSDSDCKVRNYKSIQRSPEKRFCLHCKMNTSKGCLS